MILDIQFKIKQNANYQKFLRENSNWYKYLNRDPSNFKLFEEEVKNKYKLRTSDKIESVINTFSILPKLFEILK